MRNVLDKVPERLKEEVQERLRAIMHAETRVVAESLMEELARTLERDYAKAASCIRDDAERMLAYYSFPEEHWRHLRTTNIIESKSIQYVRARTSASAYAAAQRQRIWSTRCSFVGVLAGGVSMATHNSKKFINGSRRELLQSRKLREIIHATRVR